MSYIIRSQKYYSQPVNGEDFSINTGDFTNNFVAGSGCYTKAVIELDVFQIYNGQSGEVASVRTGTNVIDLASKDLTTLFSVGDSIQFVGSDPLPSSNFSCIVSSFTDDGTGLFFESPVGTINNGNYTTFTMYSLETYDTCDYTYGVVSNELSGENFDSLVDNQSQTWSVPNIAMSPTNADWKGNILSGKDGSATIEYLGVFNDSNSRPIYQRFRIEHIFKSVPYWLDGYTKDTIPDFYAGDASLKHIWKANFKTNQASTFVTSAEVLDLEGSTPWFSESLNGELPQYELTSLTLTDDSNGEQLDSVLSSGKTQVDVLVTSINGSVIDSDTVGVIKYSYLPSPENYQPTNNGLPSLKTYDEIWLYDSLYQKEGEASTNSTIITDCTITQQSGTTALISFFLEYSPTQLLQIDNTREYRLFIEMGNQSMSNTEANITPLDISLENYTASSDIAGLMFVSDNLLHNHIQDKGTGKTDFKGWDGDEVLSTFDFDLETNLNAKIQTLQIVQGAYNETSGNWFDIERYNIPFTAVDVSNIQQINVDSTRGFRLANGNQFNDVSISTGDLTGTLQRYSVECGLRLQWQSWIGNEDADTIFYDNNKQFNGLNNKSSNYSNKNDYKTAIAIDALVESDGVLTTYRFIQYTDVYDYLTSDLDPNEWSAYIATFDSNGVEIEDSLLSNTDPTTVKVVWSHVSGSIPITTAESVLSIEPINSNQSARDYNSSIRENFSDSIFGDVTNTITSTEIISETVTIPSKIDGTKSYNIYGRLFTEDSEVLETKFTSGGGSVTTKDYVVWFNSSGTDERGLTVTGSFAPDTTFYDSDPTELVFNYDINPVFSKVSTVSPDTYQNLPEPTAGETYRVSFTVVDLTITGASSFLEVGFYGVDDPQQVKITSTGSKSFDITAGAGFGETIIRFILRGEVVGRIKDVEVSQISGTESVVKDISGNTPESKYLSS